MSTLRSAYQQGECVWDEEVESKAQPYPEMAHLIIQVGESTNE